MWIARNYLIPWAVKIGSPKFRRWMLSSVPYKNGRRVQDMSYYLWEVSKEIYAGKQKAFAEGDEAVARQVGRGRGC